MDKLTMYNAIRDGLLASFADIDFMGELTDFVWPQVFPTDGPTLTAGENEEATKLFNECYEVLVVKMKQAIKPE